MTTLTDDELLSWLDFGGLASSQPNMQTKYARQLAARFRELLVAVEALDKLQHELDERIHWLETQQEWQPIETAPKDGTIFDAWLGDCDESDRQFYCTGKTRCSPGWAWANGKFRPCGGLPGLTTFVQPTKWRPLPAPPKDGE